MSQDIDGTSLGLVAEVARQLANGGLTPEAVRFLIEGDKRGLPTPESEVLDTCEGVEITEDFLAQTMTFCGRKLKRHRNGGGWVPAEQNENDPSKPYVAETAYVGPFAVVSGYAQVYGYAQVSGNAWVYGYAQVSGNAQVYGYAWVSGNAQVYGNAFLCGEETISMGLHVSRADIEKTLAASNTKTE